jgi:carboxyl-terminal processing protease
MRRILRAGSFLAVLACGGATTGLAPGAMYAQLPVFTEALDTIYQSYVDELPAGKLFDSAIVGALRGVDPGAGFLSAEEHRAFQSRATTERADTGLAITRRGDHVVVVAAREDSPAERAGLEPGDGVLTLDGLDASDLQLWQAVDRLRGPAGSSVTLRVRREGWPEPRQLDIARAPREGSSVRLRDLGAGIALLRIRWFDDATAGEIAAALGPAPGAKVSGLVLDLRDTAEGPLPPALELLGLFLPKDRLAVTLDGRPPGGPRRVLTQGPASYRDVPLVLLANRGSAAAAEVVAGALQDSSRAAVVGTRTSGQGAGQSLIPLADGSAVWLTTTRYVTPKGHAIGGKGIAPDVVVDAPVRTDADPQLERAVQILKGAKIIGQHRDGA